MNPYEVIFKEIADGLLEVSDFKPNYSDNALLDSLLIFQSVLMDKLYDNQEYDNMDWVEREKMTIKCGDDLRKLIHTYTGLDTYELVKNYKKS